MTRRNWTPVDDQAAARRAQAQARLDDAAYRESEPHWEQDNTCWLSERAERVVICCCIAAVVVGSGICAAVAL